MRTLLVSYEPASGNSSAFPSDESPTIPGSWPQQVGASAYDERASSGGSEARSGASGQGGTAGSWPSAAPAATPAPAPTPGYPVYPQGGYASPGYPPAYSYQPNQPPAPSSPYNPYPPAPYPPLGVPAQQYPQPYPYPAQPGAGPYQGYPQYPYYPYYYAPIPPKAPSRQVYPLVVSWIVTVSGGLSLVLGLLILGIVLLVGDGQPPSDLLSLGALAIYTGPPIIGGIFAIVSGILGILGRPSPRFVLPSAVLLLGLGILAMAAGVVFDNIFTAPGPAIAALPLVITAVSLPAFALLAFTGWRLGFPSTRRATWLSFFYGTTLAALVAGLLNTFFALIVVVILSILGYNINASAVDPTSGTPRDFASLLAIILVVAVVAPLVEEGMKPLGAVLIMRRLRTPAQAFLIGMASGVGFAIVETVGDYAGLGQADWVGVAIERSTSSLLHGVGAGMGALGWYYLINGKGVPLRWLRGFGALLYAVLQHAIFNGVIATGLPLLPDPIGPFFQKTQPVGVLTFDYGVIAIFAYDVLIFIWLLYITGRLRGAPAAPGAAAQSPGASLARPELQAVAGGVR